LKSFENSEEHNKRESSTKELEEREDLTIRVLKDYARKEPRLAEIMKSLGLM